MGYRSGHTLRNLIDETRPMTGTEEVRGYIDASIGYIDSDENRRYRRGAPLVSLLKRGGLTALAHQEFAVAERLSNLRVTHRARCLSTLSGIPSSGTPAAIAVCTLP